MLSQRQSSNESVTAAPPACSLAIWALVLALLSFLLVCVGPLIAMAAVVCGHLASARIRLSAGLLGGKGLARGGLVIGYAAILVYLVIVPMFVLPAMDRARERVRERMCEDNARRLVAACMTYAGENGGYSPETLDELRPILGLSSNGLPLVFLCPASKDRSAPSYEIESSTTVTRFEKPAHVVLVREKKGNHHGRGVVAYADGTLEWVDGARVSLPENQR